MTPLDVLSDLFGSDPADPAGPMIVDTAGLAQIVIDALAEAGFQIVGADRYPAMRMMRGAAGNCRPLRHLVAL